MTEQSISRIPNTHKTHKNKIKDNSNKAELWKKINESFNIDIDKKKFKKDETNVECIYRNSGQRENCDTCQSPVSLSDEGFLICTNPKCSIIYKDIVDQTAEWRYYGVDDNQTSDPTRCGLPVNPLLLESSFGCKILCDGISSYEMRKIRRYTEWQASPHKEKTQYNEFQHITIIANNAGIPKIIIDEALRCHKKISEHQTFRGSNRDGIIAASVYIAFRIHDCPRTAKEIATIFNLDNTSATKGCKNAVCIINDIENDMHNSEKTSFCKTRPEAFIERYCTRLHVNGELTKLCQFIALRIEKNRSLIAVGMCLLALADWPVLAVLGCTLSGLGFYMMHNTLQMQATQMAPQAQSMAITLFACTLFFGQTVGVSLMARCLDASGLAEALLVAAAGIVVLCMVIARGVQLPEKLNPP